MTHTLGARGPPVQEDSGPAAPQPMDRRLNTVKYS